MLATQDFVKDIRRACKASTSKEKVDSLLKLIYADDEQAYQYFKQDNLQGLAQRHLTYIDVFLSKRMVLSANHPETTEIADNPDVPLDFHAKVRIHRSSFSTTEQNIFSRIIAEYGEEKIAKLIDPDGIKLGECLELFGQKQRQLGGPLGAITDAIMNNSSEYQDRPFRKNPEKNTSILSICNFSFNILKWLVLLTIIIRNYSAQTWMSPGQR